MSCKIAKIQYYLPEIKVTNDDLKNIFPEYDFSNFEKKVGIKNRYVVSEKETALDLAIKACEKLFNEVEKDSVDFVLLCTQSPEYFLPTTACILQDKLGLKKSIGALDFNLGCSGYIYGLAMAKSLIASKIAKNILLVTAETYSKYIHPKDRSNRSIFGDAATATLITASDEDSFGEFKFGTDGSGFDKLIVKNGCSRFSFDNLVKEKFFGTNNIYTDNHLYMDGPEIFNFTSREIPSFTKELLSKNNLDKENIDQYIFHQANAFMLNFMRKMIGISKEKFFIDLEDGGNTVSCTIPIALKKYIDKGNKNQTLVLVGFGVGLSWGGCAIKI